MTRLTQRLQRLEARWHQEMARCMDALSDTELEALATADPDATQTFLQTVRRCVWSNGRGAREEPRLCPDSGLPPAEGASRVVVYVEYEETRPDAL